MRTWLLSLLLAVALVVVATQAQRRDCEYGPWNFCELADFGPYFVKDDTGMPWAVSILRNMTCPSSVWNKNGVAVDFPYAAACFNNPVGKDVALGAYSQFTKVMSYRAPGQAFTGAMVRVQSVSVAYPEYRNQFNLLDIVINCDKDIKGAPRNISMVAPKQLNEPYLFSLTHSSSC